MQNFDYIYDIEIYKNLYLIVFKNVFTQEIKISILSKDNLSIPKFFNSFRDVKTLIGYNNLSFDHSVLKYSYKLYKKEPNIKVSQFIKKVFLYSQTLINNEKSTIDYNFIIPQVDLYKIHHFDNKNKAVSLKELEFTLGMNNIEELPYPPNTELTSEQINEVIEYCKNDVETTYKLYLKTTEEINVRNSLKKKYTTNFINDNSPKMGEKILKYYLKKAGITSFNRQQKKTVEIKNILFDYIKFNSKQLKALYSWLSNKIVAETKGAFSNIPYSEMQSLEPYYLKEDKKGKQKQLNIVYKGDIYYIGVGGIHMSKRGVFLSSKTHRILDIDVSSMYPNIVISNNLHPSQFGNIFSKVYKEIYLERKKYPKGTPENLALKLAMNGSIGKSNEENNFLFDSEFFLSITVNGQLMILMLIEWLYDIIQDLTIIQANTDGITLYLKNEDVGIVSRIVERWEKTVNLEMDYTEYKAMFIRDVNNYIALKNNASVKRKGAFEYKLELYQNHSMRIVPMAVEQYFVNNISIEQYLMDNLDNFYLFFKRTKTKRGTQIIWLNYENLENVFSESKTVNLQRINRYYISKSGGYLIKKLTNDTAIEKGYKVTVVNNLKDFSLDEFKQNVNLEYYIKECNKLIKSIL